MKPKGMQLMDPERRDRIAAKVLEGFRQADHLLTRAAVIETVREGAPGLKEDERDQVVAQVMRIHELGDRPRSVPRQKRAPRPAGGEGAGSPRGELAPPAAPEPPELVDRSRMEAGVAENRSIDESGAPRADAAAAQADGGSAAPEVQAAARAAAGRRPRRPAEGGSVSSSKPAAPRIPRIPGAGALEARLRQLLTDEPDLQLSQIRERLDKPHSTLPAATLKRYLGAAREELGIEAYRRVRKVNGSDPGAYPGGSNGGDPRGHGRDPKAGARGKQPAGERRHGATAPTAEVPPAAGNPAGGEAGRLRAPAVGAPPGSRGDDADAVRPQGDPAGPGTVTPDAPAPAMAEADMEGASPDDLLQRVLMREAEEAEAGPLPPLDFRPAVTPTPYPPYFELRRYTDGSWHVEATGALEWIARMVDRAAVAEGPS